MLDLFCAIIVNSDDASFLKLDKRFSDIQFYFYKIVKGRVLFAFLMSCIEVQPNQDQVCDHHLKPKFTDPFVTQAVAEPVS